MSRFKAADDSQIPRRSIYGKSKLTASIKKSKKNQMEKSALGFGVDGSGKDPTTAKAGASVLGKVASKVTPGLGAATTVVDAYTVPNTLMSQAGKAINKANKRKDRKRQERAIYKARERSYQKSMTKQPKAP